MARRFERAKEYTQKYKLSLLPCRYCGGKNVAILSERSIFAPSKDGWTVTCGDCGDCTAFDTSVKRALAKWNSEEWRKVEVG